MEDLEEGVVVELGQVVLGAVCEHLAGHGGQDAQVAGAVLDERMAETVGHEMGRAG